MAPGVVERGENFSRAVAGEPSTSAIARFTFSPKLFIFFLFSGCLSDRFVLFSLCVFVYKTLSDILKLFVFYIMTHHLE